ncbi:FG-GAP repeat domain-containing protein [Cystobacter fuscus]
MTLDLTWDVGRDCRGDQATLQLSASAGEKSLGRAAATARLGECAATGQTALLQTGQWPGAVRAADVDGDGRQELLLAHDGSPSLLVIFRNPEGGESRRRYVYIGRASDWMLVQDLNGDGRADVVLAEEGSAELLVLPGDARRLFGPPQAYDLGAPVSSLAFADVDRDGHPDVLGLEPVAGRYVLLGGQPDGSFVARKGGAAPRGARELLAVEPPAMAGSTGLSSHEHRGGGPGRGLVHSQDAAHGPGHRVGGRGCRRGWPRRAAGLRAPRDREQGADPRSHHERAGRGVRAARHHHVGTPLWHPDTHRGSRRRWAA